MKTTRNNERARERREATASLGVKGRSVGRKGTPLLNIYFLLLFKKRILVEIKFEKKLTRPPCYTHHHADVALEEWPNRWTHLKHTTNQMPRKLVVN